MERRHLLATLGAGVLPGYREISGRWPSVADSQTESQRRDTTTVPTSESDGQTTTDSRRVTTRLVDQQTTDRTLALAPAGHTTADHGRVELRFVAPGTAESPAVVRATLTNLNDFENTFKLSDTPPFGSHPYASPDTTANRIGMHLAPTENHDLQTPTPEFERTADGRWILTNDQQWLPETVTLDPDETIQGEYVLLNHPDSEKPPLGRYEIADEFALGLTAWQTSAPGPDGASALSETTLPSLPDDRSVNWFHDADRETDVFLRPSAERETFPADLDFTLHNHSENTLRCESFGLYKQDGDGWRTLRRGYGHNGCWDCVPGERRRFGLQAFRRKVIDGPSDGIFNLSLELDPGRYAFAISYGETYVTAFELEGIPRSVDPIIST